MRLVWSDQRALRQLAAIADFAPAQAARIVGAVEWLAHECPFPTMFLTLGWRREVHVWPVPHTHHVVMYRVDGDVLTVLAVRDGRRIHHESA